MARCNWGARSMSLFAKVRKFIKVGIRPRLGIVMLRHRVAAAIEHFEAIRLMQAATLIDIGANKGQFSLAFRYAHGSATIFAFEPLSAEALRYLSVFRRDERAFLKQVALSDRDGKADFFVTDRPDSSSLFRPGVGELEAFGVREQTVIQVPTARLDSVMEFDDLARPIAMKIDVQGGELDVLKGCSGLDRIDFIYLEASFVPLYDDQPLFDDIFAYLRERGFILSGVFNQITTDRFGPTQADCLFRRAS
jgi:FkbM family methyltransferase